MAAGVLLMDKISGWKLNIYRITQQSRNSHQFYKGNCGILVFNIKEQEGIFIIKRCVQRGVGTILVEDYYCNNF